MATDIQTITSDNSAAFYEAKMGGDPFIEAEKEAKEVEAKAEEKPKVRNPEVESRFQKLTRERKEAERRADAAEARAKELEGKQPEKPAPKTGKPKPEDYTNDAIKYAEALAAWSASEAVKADRAERARENEAKERQKVVAAFNKRVEAIKETMPDWAEMVDSASDLKVSDEVRDSIIESDYGPEILYHMASNPEYVEKLAEMTARQAAISIGKLEAKFEAAKETKEEEPQKKAAKEVDEDDEERKPPKVITPIRGKSTGENAADAAEVTDYEAYKRARQRQMAQG